MQPLLKPAFIDVNGTRLYCETAGAGAAVVFIHGFTLDTRMWDDQFLHIAQHYQAIRYDLRGFGKSAVPTEAPYSHVEDLHGLLTHLLIPQAHLVGLSLGGAIAIEFALTYPSRVQSLVLIDAVLGGYPWSDEGAARDRLVWQRAREAGIPGAKESWLAHPLFAPAMRMPQVAARMAQIVAEYSGWHFIHHNPAQGLEPHAGQRLAELKMPILALVGEEDLPDFRGCTEMIVREAPQAHLRLIPGVGHMANMEAPELVTRSILDFLTGL
jgi:3-oxoadipate enol-lactonase